MVTDEILYTGTVKNIAALIAASGLPQEAFFLAERLPQQMITEPQERQDLLRFARVSDLKAGAEKDGIDPALYTSGRVFSPDFELRWSLNQETGETQVVYLGVERKLPGLECSNELEKLKRSDTTRQYYLFGESLSGERLEQMGLEKDQGYYAEVRIPRLLRYPLSAGSTGKRRVQLSVWEYSEEETGRVVLFRFQNLEVAE